MDAILEEKLDTEGFWSAYVGNITPLEFMNRLYSPDLHASAEEYVASLPNLFGIVRRQSWRDAFGAPCQFRKGEVLSAIVEKLEATENDWRPHLNQRPRPVVTEWVPLQPDLSETAVDVPAESQDFDAAYAESEAAPETAAEVFNLHEEQIAGQDEVQIVQGEETPEPLS